MDFKINSYNIFIPGKFVSINVDKSNNILIKQNSHFSKGSKFTIEIINELKFLKHYNNYIVYKQDGKLFASTNNKWDNFDSFVTVVINELTFNLKCNEGYLTKDFKLCGNSEDALKFQWVPIKFYPSEEHIENIERSIISTNNNDKYKEFISAEGLNLINSENLSNFHLMMDGRLMKHLCLSKDQNHLVFHCGVYQSPWQVQLKVIEGEICLFCPNAGYLNSSQSSNSMEAMPMFLNSNNSRLITLKSTKNLSEYKLFSNSEQKWVRIIIFPAYSYGIFVENEHEATNFQFLSADLSINYEEECN